MQFKFIINVNNEDLREKIMDFLDYDGMECVLSVYEADGYDETAFIKALADTLYDNRYEEELEFPSDNYEYYSFSILSREQVHEMVNTIAAELDLETKYNEHIESIDEDDDEDQSTEKLIYHFTTYQQSDIIIV